MEFTKIQARKLSATVRNRIQILESDRTLSKNKKKLGVEFILNAALPGESEGGMYPVLTEAREESARMRNIERIVNEFKQLCGRHGIRIDKDMTAIYPFCYAEITTSALLALIDDNGAYLIARVISDKYDDIRDEME